MRALLLAAGIAGAAALTVTTAAEPGLVLARVSKVASVRKSVLGMLYGKYVASGQIDLDRTASQLRPASVRLTGTSRSAV